MRGMSPISYNGGLSKVLRFALYSRVINLTLKLSPHSLKFGESLEMV
jgi:hypothetical protein